MKIGFIMALTGNAAAAGQSTKAAVDMAADIINTPHPELAPLTLAATAGLPRLGGAKVEVIWADNQGSPAVGQSDALRLITQDHVVALCGAYQSSVTLTSSAVAERYGIPFLAPASVAANLTERGYKWFFRTTPIGPDIATLYLDFLAAVARTGLASGKIAVVHENTDYGTSVADSMVQT
ncbi:MAG: ABC transporter substrate-binding protein, partial [Stellaceae bacterium]